MNGDITFWESGTCSMGTHLLTLCIQESQNSATLLLEELWYLDPSHTVANPIPYASKFGLWLKNRSLIVKLGMVCHFAYQNLYIFHTGAKEHGERRRLQRSFSQLCFGHFPGVECHSCQFLVWIFANHHFGMFVWWFANFANGYFFWFIIISAWSFNLRWGKMVNAHC